MAALKLIGIVLAVLAGAAQAQQPQPQQPRPQVRVNILNVCSPNEADQKEIAAALERIPQRPAFAPDFEVARGRSVAPDGTASRWVRVRHEFPAASPFASVQYSFSVEEQGVVETLVFRLRQDKDVIQVAIEHAAAGTTPEAALAAAAAASRVRLERFGKASIALARCAEGDQSAYEPLFRAAAEVLRHYRTALNVRRTVIADLARVDGARNPPPKK